MPRDLSWDSETISKTDLEMLWDILGPRVAHDPLALVDSLLFAIRYRYTPDAAMSDIFRVLAALCPNFPQDQQQQLITQSIKKSTSGLGLVIYLNEGCDYLAVLGTGFQHETIAQLLDGIEALAPDERMFNLEYFWTCRTLPDDLRDRLVDLMIDASALSGSEFLCLESLSTFASYFNIDAQDAILHGVFTSTVYDNDDFHRSEHVMRLAHSFSDHQARYAIDHAFEVFGNDFYRSVILYLALPHVNPFDAVYAEAALLKLEDPDDRFHAMDTSLPKIAEALPHLIFQIARDIMRKTTEDIWQSKALVKLIPYLPEPDRELAVQFVISRIETSGESRYATTYYQLYRPLLAYMTAEQRRNLVMVTDKGSDAYYASIRFVIPLLTPAERAALFDEVQGFPLENRIKALYRWMEFSENRAQVTPLHILALTELFCLVEAIPIDGILFLLQHLVRDHFATTGNTHVEIIEIIEFLPPATLRALADAMLMLLDW